MRRSVQAINLKRVLKIKEMRCEAALIELRSKLSLVRQCHQVLKERKLEVSECDSQVEDLSRYQIDSEAPYLSDTLNDIIKRRRWLAFDKEKADYFRAVALQDHADAEAEASVSEDAWLQATLKYSQLKAIVGKGSARLESSREKQHQEEQDEFEVARRLSIATAEAGHE